MLGFDVSEKNDFPQTPACRISCAASGRIEQPFQMTFIDRDDMVQQVPTATSNPVVSQPRPGGLHHRYDRAA